MPPFLLKVTDFPSSHSRSQRIIYTKNEYSAGVKVQNWEDRYAFKPIDSDPLCPGSVDQFKSHYIRLGQWDGNAFTTTTKDAQESIFVKPKLNPNKRIFNYYTFNDNADCQIPIPYEMCPKNCADDYLTTMKHSYQLPYPYTMKRLSIPVIPFMQNRRYRMNQTRTSPCKFFDENFNFETCEMIKHKSHRSVSYNPLTQTYSSY